MAPVISLKVLTAEGLVVSDEAVSVVAPGGRGYVGMLRNHEPMVTTVKPGTLAWTRADGARRTVTVGEGLLEIAHNQCTVLVASVADAERNA